MGFKVQSIRLHSKNMAICYHIICEYYGIKIDLNINVDSDGKCHAANTRPNHHVNMGDPVLFITCGPEAKKVNLNNEFDMNPYEMSLRLIYG